MTRLKRAAADFRKVSRSVATSAATAAKTGELARAAGNVIAKRTAIAATATMGTVLALPTTGQALAHQAELARIIPEKSAAFSAAGTALIARSSAIAQQITAFMANETAVAGRASLALMRARSPQAAFVVQQSFTIGWLDRLVSQSIAIGTLTIAAQAAMLAPVHRAATDNAKRLGV